MKKIGIYLVYVLAFVFIMLAFACGTIAFAELGYSAVLVFTFGYAFALLSMYLIFILHELGHAFCGYLTGYRLVAFGLGNFLLTKKSGRLHLSRTAVIKNVGAQYIGLKENESDQRIILMLSGGLIVHLCLILLATLFGFLTTNWYFAGTMLRHSAQTLLAPQEYDLKDFIMSVDEDVRGSFAESVQTLQGLVFILDDNIELAKQQFQSVLEKTDNPMSKSISQLYLLQIALIEGDNKKAEEYASIRGVKSFLSLKTADMQVIQAWYQFKAKKDVVQTHKAMKIARQKMNSSRMLRDEKSYYQQWLDELEQAIQEEETQ